MSTYSLENQKPILARVSHASRSQYDFAN